MGVLNKILNVLIKLVFVLVGLAIAVVPLIYILGHQSVSRQSWSSTLERFSGRAVQLQQVDQYSISNIYVNPQKSKLAWGDVNVTLELANYLQHQLEKNDVTVVRRLLEFKKPPPAKKTKKGDEVAEVELGESNQLKETPPLRWLKDIIQPYLSFEHETLKRKHWIIVCLGDLDPKVANDIQNIQKENSLYRFIVVSPWPISSKMVDITPIPYEGTPETAIEQLTNNSPDQAEDKKQVKGKAEDSKKSNGKKEKKYKVKQVKEAVVEKNEETVNNSSKAEDL